MIKKIINIKNKWYLRGSPFKSLLKILIWKIRWKISKKPMSVRLITNQYLKTPKCGAGALIFYKGVSEPKTYEFLRYNLSVDDVFYDIGAHIGEYTVLASRIVGYEGEVHAFEPIPHIFNYLKNNVKECRSSKIILNQKVVSDKIGKVEFEVFSEPSISRILENTAHNNSAKIITESTTLNEYIKFNKFPRCIKIDVEGAELLVLRGMTELLKLEKAKAPILILEFIVSNFNNFQYNSNDILIFLKNYGYKFYDIENNFLGFEIDNLAFSLKENNLIAKK